MQIYSLPGKITEETIYQGVTFTLTRLSYDDGDGVKIIAEGLARRSLFDAPDPALGREISKGRALKALVMKLRKERIRHPLMG